MNIDDIKKCFSLLSNLGVKEVSIPATSYLWLIKTIRDNFSNGGSHFFIETLDPVRHHSIFGVRVIPEDIYWDKN